MERIFPITRVGVMPHVGRAVCAVLEDGSHYYGTLEGMDGDQMIIHGYARSPGEVETYALKETKDGKKSKDAQTSAFFPGFGFRRFSLSLASLAFLFALPFLGFPFFI
jgi:hypothetical protein